MDEDRQLNDIPDELKTGFASPIGGVLESALSRSFLLGAGLGVATVALALNPGDVFSEADAAPQYVYGSPNIVAKAFSNKKGRFRLCADGSTVNAQGVRIVDENPGAWAMTPGYVPLPKVQGKPAGSPWVTVDVVQGAKDTHVLLPTGRYEVPIRQEIRSAACREIADLLLFLGLPQRRCCLRSRTTEKRK